MTGGSIPYHLRQNKAIDRNLFADLLSKVARYRNISDYVYVGFGGAYLEDFKHIHAATRIRRMISIEKDANVYVRQKFNQPISCVELLRMSSGQFISDSDFQDDYIIWLDYTEPSKTGEQLAELEALVSKLPAGSLFKITLNANASSLGTPSDGSDLQAYRVARAAQLLGDYAPKITAESITARGYPHLLLASAASAARRGLTGRPRCQIQPLSAFTYKDGQVMLTVAGIILKEIDVVAFRTASRIDHWAFASLDWSDPVEITVPEMSFKERMFVESLLPENDAAFIRQQLEYYIGDSEEEARELLSSFVRYYRMYPWFSRVAF